MDTSQRQRIKEFCNKQFYQAVNSQARLRIFQGGTRSGKSWSLQQYCLYLMTTQKDPLTISIVRKTLPALKDQLLEIFFIYLKIWVCIGKEFIIGQKMFLNIMGIHSNSSAQMMHRKSGDRQGIILWLNEGNELLFEDYRQLAMRTRGHILIDFLTHRILFIGFMI